jgi:hypothetical protein
MTIRHSLILFISLLLLVVAITSCKKIKKLTTFDVKDSTEFIIPSTTGLNVPVVINTPEVKTSSSQYFTNNHTTASLVKDIKLKSLNLTITDPTGQTFQFLKSIKIYIYGNGQPEILLASKEDIPDDIGSSMDLETSTSNIDSYIKSSTYSLRYVVITDETIAYDVTIRANMIFSITASPL